MSSIYKLEEDYGIVYELTYNDVTHVDVEFYLTSFASSARRFNVTASIKEYFSKEAIQDFISDMILKEDLRLKPIENMEPNEPPDDMTLAKSDIEQEMLNNLDEE